MHWIHKNASNYHKLNRSKYRVQYWPLIWYIKAAFDHTWISLTFRAIYWWNSRCLYGSVLPPWPLVIPVPIVFTISKSSSLCSTVLFGSSCELSRERWEFIFDFQKSSLKGSNNFNNNTKQRFLDVPFKFYTFFFHILFPLVEIWIFTKSIFTVSFLEF